MNEKGEITLVSILLLLASATLILLCALELRKSFKLLETRTELFLCVKETKGELNLFMKFMGRTNWGIKNINRASLIMMFIPGMQVAALNTQKLKKYLQRAQDMRLISYLKTLAQLKAKSCPIDPRMYITPFKLGAKLFTRDALGSAQLREEKWNYHYLSKPYLISLAVDAHGHESIYPKLGYTSEEKMAKLSSLLSSR